jgi:hypothetical protein
MTRRILTFVVGVIVAASLATADEPPPDQGDAPLRLKKKNRANTEPARPEEKKPAEKKPDEKKDDKKAGDMPDPITRDGEPIQPEEDEKEVLERVARNMKSVEERLDNKELNEGTRQLQDDIVKDLDSLIKNAENPQAGEQGEEDMQNGNDGQKGDQSKQGAQGKQGKQGNSGAKGGKKSSGSMKGMAGRQKQKGNGSGRPGSEQAKADEQNGNGKGNSKGNGNTPGPNGSNSDKGKSGDPPNDPARDAELNKEAWGHLPEALRAQMNAYSSREKYMDKHQDLIKQYYKTIAAQGRPKEK